MAEASDFQCSIKLFVQLFERLLGAGDLMLGGIYLAGYLIHLALEDVKRNGSGVVSFHERGLFVLQRSVSSARCIECEARIGLAVRQLLADDEIDLSDSNADEFYTALAPFVDAARPIGSASRASNPRGARAKNDLDLAAVREWARANGHTVSDRGRVPGSVIGACKATV